MARAARAACCRPWSSCSPTACWWRDRPRASPCCPCCSMPTCSRPWPCWSMCRTARPMPPSIPMPSSRPNGRPCNGRRARAWPRVSSTCPRPTAWRWTWPSRSGAGPRRRQQMQLMPARMRPTKARMQMQMQMPTPTPTPTRSPLRQTAASSRAMPPRPWTATTPRSPCRLPTLPSIPRHRPRRTGTIRWTCWPRPLATPTAKAGGTAWSRNAATAPPCSRALPKP